MQLTEREKRDVTERMWFRRMATVLMVCVGAIPVIKNTLYPVQRNR